MKLLKVAISFFALVSLQIAAAQLLNIPPPVEARMTPVFTGGGVPVASGLTSPQYSFGSDDYPNATGDLAGASGIQIGTPFAGQTGTITALRMKVNSYGTSANCKIAIYTKVSSTYTRQAVAATSTVATGWISASVSYATSSGTTYWVWGLCDQTYKLQTNSSDCPAGGVNWTTEGNYADSLPSSMTSTADTGCGGFAIVY